VVVRQTITDKYAKMEKDIKFRAEVAERIGLGFKLPVPEVVPSVPRFEEREVASKLLRNREKEWLRGLDSNQDNQLQRLACYQLHYPGMGKKSVADLASICYSHKSQYFDVRIR
jgi:hypothetical protein